MTNSGCVIKVLKSTRLGNKSIKLISVDGSYQVICKTYFFSVQIRKNVYYAQQLPEAEDIYAGITQNLRYKYLIKK
jgi:hypothetical protein